jgi:hypothetical protein
MPPISVTEAADEFVSLTGAKAPDVVDKLAVVRVRTDGTSSRPGRWGSSASRPL